jgi:Ca2+/H+ antiporter
VLILSRVSALTLLGVYMLYMFFSLRGKDQSYDELELGHASSIENPRDQRDRGRRHLRSTSRQGLARMIRFVDEAHPRRADSHSASRARESIQMHSVYALNGHQRKSSSSGSATGGLQSVSAESRPSTHSNGYAPLPHHTLDLESEIEPKLDTSARMSESSDDEPSSPDSTASLASSDSDLDVPPIGRAASVILLIISSALIAVSAEFLVDTIDGMVEHTPLNHAFIGLILLPIAGNFAEHITAMTVAAKGKMDLALGVSIGSSIQISLFITPLIILAGWALDENMTLLYTPFETITLVASTLLVNVLLLNGRTNVLGGGMLCGCYAIVT